MKGAYVWNSERERIVPKSCETLLRDPVDEIVCRLKLFTAAEALSSLLVFSLLAEPLSLAQTPLMLMLLLREDRRKQGLKQRIGIG